MENINFIPANELPVAEGDEVNVICLENGEMKQKPANMGGGSGGASNVMVIHMNEDDAENQVYPEGLYDTIDRMIQNSFFDTFIIVGDASAQYNSITFRPIQRIQKDEEGYAIKLASPSSNRILHVRPDNSGWLEYEE